MQKRGMIRSHSIQNVFVFLLIGLFALGSIALAISGSRIYGQVTASAAHNNDSQLLLSYLGNKLRAFDTSDHVIIAEQNGIPTLRLFETLDGTRYVTTLYAFQGAVWERFAAESDSFDPENGTRLVAANALTFSWRQENLMEIAITLNDGTTKTIRAALRTSPGKGAD